MQLGHLLPFRVIRIYGAILKSRISEQYQVVFTITRVYHLEAWGVSSKLGKVKVTVTYFSNTAVRFRIDGTGKDDIDGIQNERLV